MNRRDIIVLGVGVVVFPSGTGHAEAKPALPMIGFLGPGT